MCIASQVCAPAALLCINVNWYGQIFYFENWTHVTFLHFLIHIRLFFEMEHNRQIYLKCGIFENISKHQIVNQKNWINTTAHKFDKILIFSYKNISNQNKNCPCIARNRLHWMCVCVVLACKPQRREKFHCTIMNAIQLLPSTPKRVSYMCMHVYMYIDSHQIEFWSSRQRVRIRFGCKCMCTHSNPNVYSVRDQAERSFTTVE